MPDKDAIQRGIHGLPQIDDPGVEGGTPPEDGLGWKSEEHDANFWVTNERKFGRNYIVLRATGDRRGTTLIERDFINALGKPINRSSEVCHPPVYSTTWTIVDVDYRLKRTKQA